MDMSNAMPMVSGPTLDAASLFVASGTACYPAAEPLGPYTSNPPCPLHRLQEEVNQMMAGGGQLTQEKMQEYKAKKAQMSEQIETMLGQVCDEAARDRLGRVKLVKPELAEKVTMAILNDAQKGKIQQKLTEDGIKAYLDRGSAAASCKVTIQRRRYAEDDDSEDDDSDLI